MTDDLERQIAEVIWTTSRADKGTISATGANIIAAALLPFIREREARAWDGGRTAGYEDRRSEGQFIRFVESNPYRTDEAAT